MWRCIFPPIHRGDRYQVVKRAIEEDQAHQNPLYFHNQFSDMLNKSFMKPLQSKSNENYLKVQLSVFKLLIALIIHFANEFYGFALMFARAAERKHIG